MYGMFFKTPPSYSPEQVKPPSRIGPMNWPFDMLMSACTECLEPLKHKPPLVSTEAAQFIMIKFLCQSCQQSQFQL